MKYIPFRTSSEQFKSRDIIKLVAQVNQQGMQLDELRKRCRILRVLEKASPTGMILEDADWEVLREALKKFTFQVIDLPLEEIIDDVLNAKEPPAPMLRPEALAEGDDLFPPLETALAANANGHLTNGA